MGSTYRYIASEEENQEILDWFSSYESKIISTDGAVHLWFPKIGRIVRNDSGEINKNESPIVSIYPVKSVCGSLLSVGEVHFLTNKLKKKFPELDTINRKFQSWIKKNELAFSSKPSFDGQWNYYLEGSIKNYDTNIYAFPRGVTLLKSEQYFVADGESNGRLDTICKVLALRGVEGLRNA